MFPEKIMKWLTLIGALTASYFTVPNIFINLGGKNFQLDKDLPQWALGLGVVIVLLLVFKVITHVLFRLAMWGIVIGLLLIVLNYLNIPVLSWVQGLGK